MARAKDFNEDVISVSSTDQSRKRKRASPSSDASTDTPVAVKSHAHHSQSTSHRSGKAIKAGARSKVSTSSLKSSSNDSTKSAANPSSDSDDESEDGIVVRSGPAPSASSRAARMASPDKPKSKAQAREPLIPPKRRTDLQYQDQDNALSRTSSSQSVTAAAESTGTDGRDIRHRQKRESPADNHVTRSLKKSNSQGSSSLLDDWLSPSPKKPSLLSSQANKGAKHDSKDDDSRVKHLLRQISSLREKQQDSEDRFDEVSTVAEQLRAEVKRLERENARQLRDHIEYVGRLEKRIAGGGNVKQQYQAEIEKLENSETRLKMDHDNMVLLLHAQIEQLKRRLAQQSVTQRQDGDAVLAKKASRLESRIRSLEREHEESIGDLKRQLEMSKDSVRLAAKDREIESIHAQHKRQIESLEQRYAALNMRYEMDKWTLAKSSYGAPYGGAPASEDVYQLQHQLAKFARDKENAEGVFKAMIDTYEAQIRRMKQQDKERDAKYLKEVAELEEVRHSLAFDVDRFSGQARSLLKEREVLQKKVTELELLVPEYKMLQLEVPRLKKELTEAENMKDTFMQENASMRKERLLYVDQLHKTREDLQDLEARLQIDSAANGSSQHVLDQYELLKSTYRLERDDSKRKRSKLRRRVKALESALSENGMDLPLEDVSSSESNSGHVPRRKKGGSVSPMLAARIPMYPQQTPPPENPGNSRLKGQIQAMVDVGRKGFLRYERAKPSYQFPPQIRERKANTRVPYHKTRLYVRSEDHTPYAPNESVSDSDDEFLEWESQAYAKSQSRNPHRQAALVNTCWNRHILDIRGNRVRSSNLHFCIEFVESYGPLLHSREAGQALLKHILKLVDLGQLTPEEGGTIVRAYNQAL